MFLVFLVWEELEELFDDKPMTYIRDELQDVKNFNLKCQSIPFAKRLSKNDLIIRSVNHSFTIIREVLILTLSIFIPLQRCICLYPLATGMILNEMINSDHNIQSHPCPQRCTDQYCP